VEHDVEQELSLRQRARQLAVVAKLDVEEVYGQ
jgi:hypothetical protein